MKRIPDRPDLGHLKKQAKQLLALYRAGDSGAAQRFREALPVAAGKTDAGIASLALRLHDAQSCIAREYGFASWSDLNGFVLARNAHACDPARAVRAWLGLVYAGDIAGGTNAAKPAMAARLLEESRICLGAIPGWHARRATWSCCARRWPGTRIGCTGRAARCFSRPWWP